MASASIRANQKSAFGLIGGVFNGVLGIEAIIVDVKKLTFITIVTVGTGAGTTAAFQPCSDEGQVKKFSAIDDVMTWLNGAFDDISAMTFTFNSLALFAKKFVPPTDPVADGLKQKVAYTKLKAGILDNKTNAQAKVTAAEGFGWNLPTANPALQSNYSELLAKLDAVTAIEAYYQAQITLYTI